MNTNLYFFGFLAGNPANSSDFVKQELRAVVSGRAAAAANAGATGIPGGGVGITSGLRVTTPQSPLGPQTPQGTTMLGANSTNPMAMSQQQQTQSQTPNSVVSSVTGGNNAGNVGSSSGSGNSLLNTASDPTLGFNFDARK